MLVRDLHGLLNESYCLGAQLLHPAAILGIEVNQKRKLLTNGADRSINRLQSHFLRRRLTGA